MSKLLAYLLMGSAVLTVKTHLYRLKPC